MYKKIGIIGGLSPESTVTYYLHVTRKYVELYGDYSYPEMLIYSVNLENYHIWREQSRWDLIANDLASVAEKLKEAGADFGLIATNTMHKVFADVQANTTLPLLHILKPTLKSIKTQGVKKIGLLGTRFTMAEAFYKDELMANGVECIAPDADQQEIVHQIIQKELVRGVITQGSKQQYITVINDLIAKGAEGIILGCTEIPLLINQADCTVPLFDTTILHADAALKMATELT